jgi:hypothetical protein
MRTCMKCIGVMMLVLTPILMAGGTQAQQRCPSGMAYCAPGAWGPGGCYNRLMQYTCQHGQICARDMSHCGKGLLGPGGCFNSTVRYCDRGAIKPRGGTYRF